MLPAPLRHCAKQTKTLQLAALACTTDFVRGSLWEEGRRRYARFLIQRVLQVFKTACTWIATRTRYVMPAWGGAESRPASELRASCG